MRVLQKENLNNHNTSWGKKNVTKEKVLRSLEPLRVEILLKIYKPLNHKIRKILLSSPKVPKP